MSQATESEPEGEEFLFAGFSLEGPLEELDSLAARKLRILESLGEVEGIDRLKKAHALAREKLSAALAAPRPPFGS